MTAKRRPGRKPARRVIPSEIDARTQLAWDLARGDFNRATRILRTALFRVALDGAGGLA